MTIPQKVSPAGDIMESVIIKGDLSKLTPDERVRYYNETCRSLGLNPLTRPFEYITLNGRLQLYARRDAADQLRKINGISIAIVSQEIGDGTLTVHVKGRHRDGREDEDLGVVPFHDGLKGEMRANQILKAVTKAKRRVTLSLCGLGFLDETEVDDIPRENPHVTRAEDIVDVPALDDPDRIPIPQEPVAELPKMQQREVAAKLGKELAACKTIAEVEHWKNLPTTSNRAWQIRAMWRDTLQGRVKEKLDELRGAAMQAAFEHEQAAQEFAKYEGYQEDK